MDITISSKHQLVWVKTKHTNCTWICSCIYCTQTQTHIFPSNYPQVWNYLTFVERGCGPPSTRVFAINIMNISFVTLPYVHRRGWGRFPVSCLAIIIPSNQLPKAIWYSSNKCYFRCELILYDKQYAYILFSSIHLSCRLYISRRGSTQYFSNSCI